MLGDQHSRSYTEIRRNQPGTDQRRRAAPRHGVEGPRNHRGYPTPRRIGWRSWVASHELADGGRGRDDDRILVPSAGFDADLPLLVELYGPIHSRILLHLGPYSPSSIRSLITATLGPLQAAAS